MSVKKRVKCLIYRLLFKLGLIGPCNAGPIPSDAKSTKKTKSKKTKKN